jgi:citrate lyase subunit gamma (acyl carrier protein)
MKITRAAVAGTLESSDVMVRIAPLERATDNEQEIDLQVSSSVEKQFGDAIRATVLEILVRHDIRGVQLIVDDKGALDCILRARLETLLVRASDEKSLPWEECV